MLHPKEITTAIPPCRRVSALVIEGSTCKETISIEKWAEVILWRCLDVLVTPTKSCLKTLHFGVTAGKSYNTPILRRLSSDTSYAALIPTLESLHIRGNHLDESADLGTFSTQATHLRELAFIWCGLTSLWSLTGPRLETISVSACPHFLSLAGIEGCPRLTEIDASHSDIRSIDALQGGNCCAVLRKVFLNSCPHITSLEGLEGREWLEEVDASSTPLASLEALRGCLALKKLNVSGCFALTTLEGIEYHPLLQEVDISGSAVTSLLPLQTGCPALVKVDVSSSNLTTLDGLEGHACLETVDASFSYDLWSVGAVTVGCPALRALNIRYCDLVSVTEEELEVFHTLEVEIEGYYAIQS